MSIDTHSFQEQLRALPEGQTLRIRGQGSKQSLLRPSPSSQWLDTASLSGVIDYQPSELVIRVGAGTPLAELHKVLAEKGQQLPCDPLMLGGQGSVGGAVASALAGARRHMAGSIRDFVLGLHILDGNGRLLRFGGQVIKNVAGYDVSRMMCGSWGQLGLITEVSLRTLPLAQSQATLMVAVEEPMAIIHKIQAQINLAMPLWASHMAEGVAHLRFEGNRASVDMALKAWDAQAIPDDQAQDFWHSRTTLPEIVASWGNASVPEYWRLCVPPMTPLNIPEAPEVRLAAIEWHGALRWIKTVWNPHLWQKLSQWALAQGGSLMRMATPDRDHPDPIHWAWSPIDAKLNRQIQSVFDPRGIFV